MSLNTLKNDPTAPSDCVFLSLNIARERSTGAIAKVNEAHNQRQNLASQDKEKVCVYLDDLYSDAIKQAQQERMMALRATRTLAIIRKRVAGAAAAQRRTSPLGWDDSDAHESLATYGAAPPSAPVGGSRPSSGLGGPRPASGLGGTMPALGVGIGKGAAHGGFVRDEDDDVEDDF